MMPSIPIPAMSDLILRESPILAAAHQPKLTEDNGVRSI